VRIQLAIPFTSEKITPQDIFTSQGLQLIGGYLKQVLTKKIQQNKLESDIAPEDTAFIQAI
jgi:hypothetical protein